RDIKDLLSYYKGEKEEYQVFWEGLHQGGFSSIYINNLNIPNAKETILQTKYLPNFSAERFAQGILDADYKKRG
ncbi:MAG: hypothetical protein Q8L87_15670, partial [Anaerolineales bacterium]|nr:hypothetical protein [Anaerolineales bacterium]